MTVHHFTGLIHLNPVLCVNGSFQIDDTGGIVVRTASGERVIIELGVSADNMLYTAGGTVQITVVVSDAILIPVKGTGDLQVVDAFRRFDITQNLVSASGNIIIRGKLLRNG